MPLCLAKVCRGSDDANPLRLGKSHHRCESARLTADATPWGKEARSPFGFCVEASAASQVANLGSIGPDQRPGFFANGGLRDGRDWPSLYPVRRVTDLIPASRHENWVLKASGRPGGEPTAVAKLQLEFLAASMVPSVEGTTLRGRAGRARPRGARSRSAAMDCGGGPMGPHLLGLSPQRAAPPTVAASIQRAAAAFTTRAGPPRCRRETGATGSRPT